MVEESFTSGPDRVCDLQSPEIFRLFRHIHGISNKCYQAVNAWSFGIIQIGLVNDQSY